MKMRLSIITMTLLCSLSISCGLKHPGPEMTKEGVHFSFSAPKAKSVTIAGNFNAWDIHKHSLEGPDKQGLWSIVIPLQEGRYEYLFVVDGKDWRPDPWVPAVDDGFGGKNSVIIVPGEHPGR